MEGVTKLFESIGAWADAHPTVIKDLPELLLAQVAGVGAVRGLGQVALWAQPLEAGGRKDFVGMLSCS